MQQEPKILVTQGAGKDAAALAALLATAGINAIPSRQIPVRQLTEADADRIAAAQVKRERKAVLRATQAAKQGEKP